MFTLQNYTPPSWGKTLMSQRQTFASVYVKGTKDVSFCCQTEWCWSELHVCSRGGNPGSADPAPGGLPLHHPHADIRHRPHCGWGSLSSAAWNSPCWTSGPHRNHVSAWMTLKQEACDNRWKLISKLFCFRKPINGSFTQKCKVEKITKLWFWQLLHFSFVFLLLWSFLIYIYKVYQINFVSHIIVCCCNL